jgi:hypothetical protein
MGLVGSKFSYVILTTCATREDLLRLIVHLEHNGTGLLSGQWCFTGNYTSETIATFAKLPFVQKVQLAKTKEELNGYLPLEDSRV